MGLLHLYNTLSRTVEEFVPGGVKKNSVEEYLPVTIYSCGPTVYNFTHIGNFRTYVLNDLLRRYLLFKGYKVNHTMNITDVDDKTIAGSIREGISLADYTERYTKIFLDDLALLNIEKVEHLPKATESIDAMDEIINKLDEKGYVYKEEGSLYFRIGKYSDYGRLSNLEAREIKAGTRYDADEYQKDDVRDFALWKATKENEPSWTIKMGKGRPGWHIECSAMVRKIFGATIDIHTGGVDLIFPHHENEIAQSEAAYGEKFVRHWVHWEHLLVDGAKMSKSLKNVYTIQDIVDKGYTPRALRYLLMSAHYRKQLNFTFDSLGASASALEKIDNFVARVSSAHSQNSNEPAAALCASFVERFNKVMDDDLNTSGAIGALFEFIREINSLIDKNGISQADSNNILETLRKIDEVFGFIFFTDKNDGADVEKIEQLIRERAEAKSLKDFARADSIRDRLLAEGIVLEDGKEGTRWKRKV